MTSLTDTYRRYTYDLAKINLRAQKSPRAFIDSVEETFREDLDKIFEDIMTSEYRCRIIMLTGPSSSGKTTTAKILQSKFNKVGKTTNIISLDNFYIGKGKIPTLKNGEYDYESLEALDIPFIKSCIKSILKNDRCVLPKYNFLKGEREECFTELKADENSMIIIEGIHALNPIFIEGIQDTGIKKIYISVKQGVKDNGEKLLKAEDVRFLRRLVRDILYRGSNAEETLSMWDNVCAGERKYIRPFKYLSDYTLNTFHPYEISVIRNDVLGILLSVDSLCSEYSYASRIIAALKRFVPVDKELVPSDSLLREFIGGSSYEY